ncbi:MAG TPA: hydantoinase B/oxoprolinase family protein [Gaiellales bacterium]|nr:hydantoinase B/oxoprolinase family protein [Gaiellales bacterium]
MSPDATVVSRAGVGRSRGSADADPVTTEIVRQGLNAAADQMKRALVRTSFSPVIYEVLDFAAALYDRDVCLLAQAPTLPVFMGTMSFCVQGAVDAVGGEQALEPGDIILYNDPFGTGSHPQDAAMVMPVFLPGGDLVGYSAIKAHWLDIGGKDPYSTDTVDVFQEGTIFPGVKLFSRGRLVSDIFRFATANSRVPKMVAGDINATVAGVRTGAAGLVRVVERYGREGFEDAVSAMYDHGEALVRDWFSRLPHGRYVGRGEMDSNGVSDDPVPFEVTVDITADGVRLDFSDGPPQQEGPINCPLPSTVSASRIAISMLAGGGVAPNEGHFRPIEIVTRPGTVFHPLHPAPCFLYGWIGDQSIEAIYRAVAQAMPTAVPACSGGDICALVWWGNREGTGEPWTDGSPHPVGQGASAGGDGASSLMHVSEAATRFTPTEVWEAKNPWIVERVELAQDSCGAGRHRGGLGVDLSFHMLEDAWLTSAVERTRNAPWGLQGGGDARPNSVEVELPDGSRTRYAKATRVAVPKGATVHLHTGGGGGYGDPAERDAAAVRRDLADGYISEEHARSHYPHALEGGDG